MKPEALVGGLILVVSAVAGASSVVGGGQDVPSSALRGALLAQVTQPPPPLQPPTTPPAPPAISGPPYDPTRPTTVTPEGWGAMFNMAVWPHTPSWFTIDMLGRPPEAFDRVECYGRLLVGGHVRYFVDGTSPTALAGTVVPPAPPPPVYPAGPERTLDGPERFFVYTPTLLKGFKVIAVSQPTVIQWTCMRGI